MREEDRRVDQNDSTVEQGAEIRREKDRLLLLALKTLRRTNQGSQVENSGNGNRAPSLTTPVICQPPRRQGPECFSEPPEKNTALPTFLF